MTNQDAHRPRPRFDIEHPAPPNEILAAIREAMETSPAVHGLVLDEGAKVELMLAEERTRFWSPQLSALITATESGGSFIKARFGPHPHVWGMFLAGYALGLMLTCAAAMFGIVQWWLDMTPWAFWLVPAAMLITALTYGAAYIGQGLGASQMHELRNFLGRAIEE